MRQEVSKNEPQRLVDTLITGAIIEARSCERFAKLAPFMDDDIAKFYVSLLRSEARHYQDYLTLAEQVAGKDISERVTYFGKAEAELISSPDTDFKFHSGIPAWYKNARAFSSGIFSLALSINVEKEST